jgi:hypothetical protein
MHDQTTAENTQHIGEKSIGNKADTEQKREDSFEIELVQ